MRSPGAGAVEKPKARGASAFLRTIGVAAVLAFAAASGIVATDTASADDYASWSDVEAAQNDVSAAQVLEGQISEQIARLDKDLTTANTEVVRTGNEFQAADLAYQAKNDESLLLQQQATEADELARSSEKRAGQLAARLARTGSGDVSMNLFAQTDGATDLLYGLEMTQRLSQQSADIQQRAEGDRNNAQALTDAAESAREQLEVLRVEAEAKLDEARAASEAVQAALTAQEMRGRELRAQLAVLQKRSSETQASYQAGEAERVRIENERLAREAAAAAEAIKNGQMSASGWSKPAYGWITSVFGWSEEYGGYHKGLDIASGCGNPIYAGSAGVVVFAAEGWNGGYGNQVIVDHGGGVVTVYPHIRNGGILVGFGQAVASGQQIAEVGTTGNSTGCHLHYEVRVGGSLVDPYTFMQDRGISLG